MNTDCLRSCLLFATALTLLLDLAPTGKAAEPVQTWPQWRGPTRDGFVGGPTWPTSLGQDHLKLMWHVDLGPGYPGPIVAADRVFVVETKDEKTEVVRALDRETGRELWNAGWPGAMSVPFMAKRNGDWIRSTPAYDGHAYIHLRNRRFTCLDLSTGKQKWTTKPFGQYWSLIAQRDHILALDQRGELLLIRANLAKFELLDSRKISDQETWGHLAVCDDQVFVRELNGISVYRWR